MQVFRSSLRCTRAWEPLNKDYAACSDRVNRLFQETKILKEVADAGTDWITNRKFFTRIIDREEKNLP